MTVAKNMRISLFVAILMLGGCKTLDSGHGIGAAIGGVAGAVIGKEVPDEDNETLGIISGAAVGAFVGDAIGEYLSQRDKEMVANSSVAAASTGTEQEWKNEESGNSGTTKVVNSGVSTDDNCRKIEQTVQLDDGSEKSDTVTACKGANGWEVVS